MTICQEKDCPEWEPNKKECDDCIDGRLLEAVNDYASTCDGCAEQTRHDIMYYDEEADLGYCEECARKMNVDTDILLEKFGEAQ